MHSNRQLTLRNNFIKNPYNSVCDPHLTKYFTSTQRIIKLHQLGQIQFSDQDQRNSQLLSEKMKSFITKAHSKRPQTSKQNFKFSLQKRNVVQSEYNYAKQNKKQLKQIDRKNNDNKLLHRMSSFTRKINKKIQILKKMGVKFDRY